MIVRQLKPNLSEVLAASQAGRAQEITNPRPNLTSVFADDVSSLDALGVVRNLPSAAAGAAFDPVVIALVGDLQQDLDHGGIGLRDVLALPEMTCGRQVERVEPNTVVGDGLAEVFGRAHALCLPQPGPS
jgi:hypothetical protein